MASSAATCGMGVALVPRLLIEAELARGELVLAHPAPLPGERHYYLVLPENTEAGPAVELFSEWLQSVCTTDSH